MPTVVRKDLDNTSTILTVTVTREELKPKLDAELKRFRQRAAIKGFRQGQAPAEYVKRMFGSSIFGDVLNDFLSNELYGYLRESKLDVLGQPLPVEDQQRYSFKIDNPEPEYSVSYEVGFVAPFEIKGLDKSASYERYAVADLDALAEEDLEYARKRMGKRSNPENDIQDNDIVRIASKELDGDKVKEGGYETTITVFLQSVKDEAIKAELLTKKKGDTIRFNARALEQHEDEKMYRKYILSLEENDNRVVGDLYEGVIEDVSRVEVADLNEEFYTGYFGGGVDSKEAAIDKLKAGIAQFYEVRANALLMRNFQETLLKNNQIEMPEKFLKRWLKINNESLSAETIEDEFEAFADNLRWSMIKDRIKAAFDLEVTEADVRAEFARRVRNYFQADLPDSIIDSSVDRLLKNEKDVEETRKDLESDKIFTAIRDAVNIVDKPISSKEFHTILEEVTKKAGA